MITINGKKFAENETEFTDSLFSKGGTCIGYAKRLKRSVKVMDHQKNLIAVINKYGCLCKATPRDDGKIWYSYGDIDAIGPMSLLQWDDDLQEIATRRVYNNADYECFYK